MMTDDEIIAVVKSHKEGKKIQWVGIHEADKDINWRFLYSNHPSWNFESHLYRVAPEPRKPRECEIYFRNGFGEIRNFNGDPPINGTSIHVREVLE